MLRFVVLFLCLAVTANAQTYRMEQDLDLRPGAGNPYVRQPPIGVPPSDYTIRPVPDVREAPRSRDMVPIDPAPGPKPYLGGRGMGAGGRITADRRAETTFYLGPCRYPNAYARVPSPAILVSHGGRKLRRVNTEYEASEIYCTP